MLNSVEHETSFITLGPGLDCCSYLSVPIVRFSTVMWFSRRNKNLYEHRIQRLVRNRDVIVCGESRCVSFRCLDVADRQFGLLGNYSHDRFYHILFFTARLFRRYATLLEQGVTLSSKRKNLHSLPLLETSWQM